MRIIASLVATAVATAALFASGLASAEIYKWKDADGVVHYTDSPPPKGTSVDRVSVRQGPVTAAPAAEQAPAAATASAAAPGTAGQASPEATAQVAKLREQACANARARAQQLANLPSVAMDLDGDGKAEELNADQHAAQLERANQSVAQYCGGG